MWPDENLGSDFFRISSRCGMFRTNRVNVGIEEFGATEWRHSNSRGWSYSTQPPVTKHNNTPVWPPLPREKHRRSKGANRGDGSNRGRRAKARMKSEGGSPSALGRRPGEGSRQSAVGSTNTCRPTKRRRYLPGCFHPPVRRMLSMIALQIRSAPFGGPRWAKRTVAELGLESTVRRRRARGG